MQNGYSVAKNKGLSKEKRQLILRDVFKKGILTKQEIIDHLTAQIRLKEYSMIYADAIKKWEEDIQFVEAM